MVRLFLMACLMHESGEVARTASTVKDSQGVHGAMDYPILCSRENQPGLGVQVVFELCVKPLIGGHLHHQRHGTSTGLLYVCLQKLEVIGIGPSFEVILVIWISGRAVNVQRVQKEGQTNIAGRQPGGKHKVFIKTECC
jgi:hypothetical protein